MSAERFSPEADQEHELQQANEIFAWLQEPTDTVPELSEVSRRRLNQIAGDRELLDIVDSFQHFDDAERLGINLTLSGFEQSIIAQLIDDETIELAIKKAHNMFTDSDNQPLLAVSSTARQRDAPVASRRKTAESRSTPTVEEKAGVEADLFGMFLKEIGRTALLDAENEVELSKAIEAGLYAEKLLGSGEKIKDVTVEELEFLIQDGKAAKQRFLEANTRLVVSIAKKYYWHRTPLPDRTQNGMIGLIRAVEKFDYAKGYKFSTYASWWIKQQITRSEADTGRTIRLPVHGTEKLNKVSRLQKNMAQELGRPPTDEELSTAAGFDVPAFMETVKAAVGTRSLNELIGDEGDGELGDFIAFSAESGFDDIDRRQTLDVIRGAIETSSLTAKEKKVVADRYGIGGDGVRTLDSVASELGISPERVRQIQNTALQKMAQIPELRELAGEL